MYRTAFVLAAATSCALALESQQNIFDDDHDFMKGFETGVMTRGKDVSVTDYGCAELPKNKELETIFGFVDMALDGVKPFLPDDFELVNGIEMAQTYATNLIDLLGVLDRGSSQILDHYCRGLVFGRIGSQGIADIAMLLRNQDMSNVELVPSKDGKRAVKQQKKPKEAKGGKNTMDMIGEGVKMAGNLFKTAKGMKDGKSEDL